MKRGFTLVEMVLAATLAALCIGFLLSLLPTGLLTVRNSERRDYAGAWAQRIVEEHRDCPAPVLDAVWPNPKPMGQESYANAVFQAEFQVRPNPAAPQSRIIRATVSWSESGRRKSTFRELVVCRSSR